MSRVICVLPTEYQRTLARIGRSISNLTPCTSDVPQVISQAETMRKYREILSEIEKLLIDYKLLLERDKSAIGDVEAAMVERDRLLAERTRRW